ncbi:D-allulose-6-phosphate 3-epimerase [Anaerotaenia torta]|uniref:D-allulose 6-phosphate 3-epimerase n=1 Tax=Anaerotaenia torta TaxID=433293 RepID=UPI003D1D4E14
MKKPIFGASLMCMDLLHVEDQLKILNNRIDMYHADIMDGHYAKNITLSPVFVQACSKAAAKPIECHLMVEHPGDYIEELAKAGASIISCHAETINHEAFRLIDKIETLGCQFGVTLNPATPLVYVKHYLNHVKLLTIMTVDIGYSGSKFVPEVLDKIREAKAYREEHNLDYIIQVDGACNIANFKAMDEAGAEAYVMGNTGLFGLAPDLNEAIDLMYRDFETAVSPG